MRAARSTKGLVKIPKKFFAGGGSGKKIDPNLKEFDVVFLGGLHNATLIKWLQQKHFHGTMAGFNHRSKFTYDHLYDYVLAGNMKSFKYSAMPYSSLFDTAVSRAIKESITEIHPERNEVVTAKGEVYRYKTLVLDTGLKQEAHEDPILRDHVMDGEYGKSRVFAHETGSNYHLSRNTRIFHMHKDNDFIIYLQGTPNKRESYEHLYLSVDSYLSRGLFTGNRNRGMRVRVITPNEHLFKFPFANEIVMEEISNRPMIDVHFGMELQRIEVNETYDGPRRQAYFKDLKTGKEVIMDFGTFLTSPANKKRKIYENNDLADEHGQVLVNPYSLQHLKYPNVFAFGDCAKLPTTRGLYASLNQSVVVRNNLWDYLNGTEMKAVYEGYSAYNVFHAVDKLWVFKHYYEYQPTAFNFCIPRFLGYPAFKLKNMLERQYFSRIYSKKPNAGYPYIQKDKFFRPLNENRFLKEHKLTVKDVFPHVYHKPELSYEKHHHGHDAHVAGAH